MMMMRMMTIDQVQEKMKKRNRFRLLMVQKKQTGIYQDGYPRHRIETSIKYSTDDDDEDDDDM